MYAADQSPLTVERADVQVKDKSGNVTQEIEDRRSSTWFFVRGPLPDNLPVRELDVPWQVMGFE